MTELGLTSDGCDHIQQGTEEWQCVSQKGAQPQKPQLTRTDLHLVGDLPTCVQDGLQDARTR